jgi:hypothetical protein
MPRQRRSASRDESQERLCDLLDRRLGFDRYPIEVIATTRLRAQSRREGRPAVPRGAEESGSTMPQKCRPTLGVERDHTRRTGT